MVTLYRFVLFLHIVAIISWMAGILYLFRLFVYHAAETADVVKERFIVMERRLSLVIMTPAMAASLLFGAIMLVMNPDLLRQPWMHMKLTLVVALMGMSHFAGKVRKRLAEDNCGLSEKTLRVLNEVPTILMVGIVFLVVLRPLQR